nr:MAG TPA: hypothetical protein [Caudoviricetes sp.]
MSYVRHPKLAPHFVSNVLLSERNAKKRRQRKIP